jgi:hypothetical protein
LLLCLCCVVKAVCFQKLRVCCCVIVRIIRHFTIRCECCCECCECYECCFHFSSYIRCVVMCREPREGITTSSSQLLSKQYWNRCRQSKGLIHSFIHSYSFFFSLVHTLILIHSFTHSFSFTHSHTHSHSFSFLKCSDYTVSHFSMVFEWFWFQH